MVEITLSEGQVFCTGGVLYAHFSVHSINVKSNIDKCLHYDMLCKIYHAAVDFKLTIILLNFQTHLTN